MITDMTEGRPAKILWKFTLPMLGSVIFQQMYNISDSIIAGNFITADGTAAGQDAVAAIGSSQPITMIFMAIAIGCNLGASVVISQLFGAKRYTDMKTAIHTAFCTTAVISLLLTVIGALFSAPLMHALDCPENIFHDAGIYLNVYIYGLFFMFLYNICTGIFTALGDSRTPFFFLVCSSLGNIVLDIVFVVCFSLGVAGIAWATFIAQSIAAICSFFFLLYRLKIIGTTARPRWFSPVQFKQIMRLSIPCMLQQSFISVGNLLIQGLINAGGSAVIAGFSSAVKLNTFALMTLNTMCGGLSSYTAQNIGAQKYDRVAKGLRAGLMIALIVSVPFVILYQMIGEPLIRLFMQDGGAEAVTVGNTFLRMVSPFYLVIGIKIMIDGVLRGANAMAVFMITTFTDLILRVAFAFILTGLGLGFMAIPLSWICGWATATVLSIVFYRTGIWKPREMRAAAKKSTAELPPQ